ncbi:MAG: DNA polymerase domain-containing protein [Thermoplasmata archaeon]
MAEEGRPDGWLLDIRDSADGRSVILWVKARGTGRTRAVTRAFRPPFYVGAPRAERAALVRALLDDPEVESVRRVTERSSLFDERPSVRLAVTPRSNRRRRALAEAIDRRGNFHRYTLFDVDLGAPQLYYLAHDLFPFAPVVERAGAWHATEPAEAIDYEPAPLRTAALEVRLDGSRGARHPAPGARVATVRLGPELLEGPEEELLRALPAAFARVDPDVVLTDDGDAFDLPWLYGRAAAHDLSDAEFVLGRGPGRLAPTRRARSYASYGQILHSAAAFDLPGRFHIDRENSFLFEDTDLPGLVDAARLSRLSLQSVARQSPGTCFSAMEIAEAIRSGYRVPWKKNRPERFRPADHLVAADRGGTILRPPVGVFDRLDEFDFASLFPQIMVHHNLSAETLDCRCCPRSPHIAPEVGYRSCTRRVGLLPRTLLPLLARRTALKAAMRRPGIAPAEARRLRGRVKMLKWILVTAFGYQGYRNARFGRIEVHEAINAYARTLFGDMVHDAEEADYRFVHGIVDSMWLAPGPKSGTPEEFARSVSERTGLPLGYEGRYRWIVFLPTVADGFGVANRYYGCYETGELKLRGIGARRHDTTALARRLEGEILELFVHARDAREFRALIPRALARADRFAERVAEGRWPVEELVVTRRVSAAVDDYAVFTETVSALRQSEAGGEPLAPGEKVRYVLLDERSRSWRDRVRLASELTGAERYDPIAYLELLAREVETLLAPFGIDRQTMRARWKVPSVGPRGRYGSPGRPEQRRLPEPTEVLDPASLVDV